MDFINRFCAATTVVPEADWLEEARMANAMHSACVLRKSSCFWITWFCHADGTASELTTQCRWWHQHWEEKSRQGEDTEQMSRLMEHFLGFGRCCKLQVLVRGVEQLLPED